MKHERFLLEVEVEKDMAKRREEYLAGNILCGDNGGKNIWRVIMAGRPTPSTMHQYRYGTIAIATADYCR